MSPNTSNQALAPGIKLGSYLIQKILGTNMDTFTYLAFDRESKRDVIIKENFPLELAVRDVDNFKVRPKDYSHEQSLKAHHKAFLEQGQNIANLRHPGIVNIENIYEALGTAYAALTFIPGNTLKTETEKRANSNAPWTGTELTELLEHILKSLEYIHHKKVLHRNISPDHIILTPSGQPVLIGFGMDFSQSKNRDVKVIISSDCAAPEQILNISPYDISSEIYALGATFYKILMGCYPQRADLRFYSSQNPRLSENPELISQFPHSLLSSIDKALEPKVEKRFTSASDWLDFLDIAQASDHIPTSEDKLTPLFIDSLESNFPETEIEKRSVLDYDDENEAEAGSSRRKRHAGKRTNSRKSLMDKIKDFFIKKVDEDNEENE